MQRPFQTTSGGGQWPPEGVEVIRSARRTRTVQARHAGDKIVVRIPARFSAAEEREAVGEILAKLSRRTTSHAVSDEDLLARAEKLNKQVLDGKANIGCVRWASTTTLSGGRAQFQPATSGSATGFATCPTGSSTPLSCTSWCTLSFLATGRSSGSGPTECPALNARKATWRRTSVSGRLSRCLRRLGRSCCPALGPCRWGGRLRSGRSRWRAFPRAWRSPRRTAHPECRRAACQ